MEPTIGEYRLIPKGAKVWSIALQENVKFEKNLIVRITNTTGKSSDGVFGQLGEVLYELPGCIPTLVEKSNGDVSFSYSKTKPYKLPKLVMV